MSLARLKFALALGSRQAERMHVQEHEPIEELRLLVKREKDPRVARRMQAVVLARCGKTAPQIVEATGMSRRPVQRWVACYNARGVTGLRGTPHPGKPPKLTPQQQQELCEKLDAGADYEQDGVCVLRGEQVRSFIAERFGVLYHLNHVYKLLGKLGYSSLMPRPRHKRADPEAQAKWLEHAPPFYSRSETSGPTRPSACGSGTRHAWASRER